MLALHTNLVRVSEMRLPRPKDVRSKIEGIPVKLEDLGNTNQTGIKFLQRISYGITICLLNAFFVGVVTAIWAIWMGCSWAIVFVARVIEVEV